MLWRMSDECFISNSDVCFFQNKLMQRRVDYWIAKNTIDLLIYPAWIIVSTS